MHTRGTIFHHSRLVYHDGVVGIKYLILLNTPSKKEPYLFVKATSQKKDRPTIPGCLKKHSLFFIQGGKAFFPKDTWLQLDELYALPQKDIDTDENISEVGALEVKMIDDVVNCLFESEGDNIAPIFKNILRPPIQDSVLKLKDMFNKGRC